MTLDEYLAIVDTAILVVIVVWALLDRTNTYFRKK